MKQSINRRDVLRFAGASVLVAGVTTLTTATAAHATTTDLFRWCNRCQGMWRINDGSNGHCPVHHWWDHSHYTDGSGIYWFRDQMPVVGEDTIGQLLLTWCVTCKAVYLIGGRGVCPNNSAGHTSSLQNLRVEVEGQPELSGFRKQSGWRACRKCTGFFYAFNGIERTHCPAGGNHDPFPNLNLLPRIR